MQVDHLVALVEEPSMEAALELLLPKLLRIGMRFEIRQFECKSEMFKRLPARLKGYASWLPPTSRLLVLMDRDDDDCMALKQKLESMASAARLGTSSMPLPGRVHVINRIAVEELEAWFFGDWQAVRAVHPRMDPHTPTKAPYRICDGIAGGTWEALERELQRRGYFLSGLPKVEFARSVAAHMNPATNRSHSFQALRAALESL